MLPEQFLNRMEKMLGEDYGDFVKSYDRSRYQSLRISHLKDFEGKAREKVEFLGEKVPWAQGGYYYKENACPGKHPFHEAGVYYIQEASAMAPAAALGAAPGERILDLCAAPGGKSTQIADAMAGRGLLICNEIHPQRVKILSENIERMGVTNALVLNHEPAYLANHFPEYFDGILVDAPCSGEGMFRKNEDAAEQWSQENVELCAARQRDIMERAASMLRRGGRMVYSTCTFAPEEDEGIVDSFLKDHPEFSLGQINISPGMEQGRPEFVPGGSGELTKTVRLWPHKLKGEGHFMALLIKEGETAADSDNTIGGAAHGGFFRRENFSRREKGIPEKDCGEWMKFKEQYLKKDLEGIYVKFGDQLFLVPTECPPLKGLKVLRAGLHLGTEKKNRFEPSHALALSLKPEEAVFAKSLSIEQAQKYLKGETFAQEGEKGWYLICVEGYSLGWGKLAGGVMKNHYPRGLRK